MTRFRVRKKLRRACSKAKHIAFGTLNMQQTSVSQSIAGLGIRKASLGLVTITVLSLVTAQAANAAAVRTGTGLFNSNTLEASDEFSTDPVDIGFTANFYGVSKNQVSVNNNGNITFDGPLNGGTLFDLTSTERQIIAPFFADVDTRSIGEVTYGTGIVNGRNAFGTTWSNVSYFPFGEDKTNTFQLVLVDRSDTGEGNFDIEFNYDNIEWETGGIEGGTDGLGGNSARVGFSNGTGVPGTSFELPGSGVNGAFINGGTNSLVANKLNSDVDGRYLFAVRNEPVPEPLSILGSLAATGVGVALRRKYKQQQKETAKL